MFYVLQKAPSYIGSLHSNRRLVTDGLGSFHGACAPILNLVGGPLSCAH
jgi:hypothetical protein